MPKINIDLFEVPPEEGQEVTVKGKVISINPDNGDVEISYDSVTTGESMEEENEGESNPRRMMKSDEALDSYMKDKMQSSE